MSAARDGHAAALQLVTAQAGAGLTTDAIAQHQQDTAAWLLSEATTADGQAYARQYDDTATALVADLRQMERPGPDLSPGAAHPDPVLASRGWQACPCGHGVYVRRAAERELEAG